MNKKGFTLAEVLITLTILGVVATLIIPNIVKSYEKRQTITKLQKIYSELNRLMTVTVIENGPVSTWQGTSQEKIQKYIIPYLKVKETLTMPEVRNQAGGKFYQISGKQETSVTFIQGSWDNSALAVNLTNGIQLWINIGQKNCFFYVDLNGHKKPNTFGKDIFTFFYWAVNERLALDSRCDGDTEYKRRSIDEFKSGGTCPYKYGCNKNDRGMWCGALIEALGWKITKDYPW